MFSNRSCVGIKQVAPIKLQRRNIFGAGITFFFKKYLLLTNTLSSGLCMGLGDLIEQEREYQKNKISKRYNWTRLGQMFVVGMGKGPPLHYYYLHIDRVLPITTVKTAMKKIAIDQFIASPILILYFFYALGVLEEKSLQDITAEIKKKFVFLYMSDCLYWVPVQFINFYYLPSQYRVSWLNLASMVYNIFLSYVKYYDARKV